MDTVTYPDNRVAEFIEQHCIPVKLPVKQNRRLVDEYLVSWTPTLIVADGRGRVHYRIEGYLPPNDLMAYLSLGIGRYLLNRKQFAPAANRFEEVAAWHQGTDAGAEALYWLGVADYKETHDPTQLQGTWQRLSRDYPESSWTRRSKIPALTAQHHELL